MKERNEEMKEEKKDDTLERQLFTWQDWEQFDTAGFIFLNVTLIKDIGQFKAGEWFHCANVDYQTSKLELIKDEESKEGYVFSLNITATFSGKTSY